MEQINVRMLGEFSLSACNTKIADTGNRSRTVWLLLAYILCHQNRPLSQEELVDVLYGDDPKGTNPANALKTSLHRVRALLDQLWPGAGHELILRQEGGYRWNPQCPTKMDIHEFDALCQSTAEDENEVLDSYLSALALYQGEFLNKMSSQVWVIPLSTHFHNLAIQTAQKAVSLLVRRGRIEEAEQTSRSALALEPYHEGLHSQLMQILLNQGRNKDVIALYETLSQRLFDEFGVMPSDEILSLYRKSLSATNTRTLPMDMILARLKETNSAAGALVCEYDYFVILCRAEARSMVRDGKAAHVALISVTDSEDNELPKRSQDRTMDNLETQIRTNLRRGDALTRCSASQFLILLPQANYENSCMVCRRIFSAFARRYPHSPAKLRFTVQPLEPNL